MECNFKIERDPHVKGYTMISNASNGKVLSLAAKGLLKELLSLPPDWYLSVDGLVRNLKESKRVVVSVLKELEDNGYLIKEKRFRQSNTCKRRVYTYFYTIIENPNNEQLQNEDIQNEYLQNEYVQNEGVQNDGVIIINNKEINKDNKDLDNNNKDYSSSTTTREEEEFVLDEKAFVQMFNKYVDATHSKIKRLHGLDKERMDKVKYLVEKYGVQEFGEFLCKAMTSKFLNADGNEKWATFDWLINENNFLKVVEDNYKELYNDNKPNNDGRTNNGLAGEAPQTNAERAGEWATNRIKEIVEKSKRKNQGGVHGELPDGGSNDRFLLPF